MSGIESIPGPGWGGVREGEGERDPPARWGWECEAEGEGRKGSCVDDEGDEAWKICRSVTQPMAYTVNKADDSLDFLLSLHPD